MKLYYTKLVAHGTSALNTIQLPNKTSTLERPRASDSSQGSNEDFRSTWATKQDWPVYRTHIEQLYGENTLPEVVRLIESQHGFKVSSVCPGRPSSFSIIDRSDRVKMYNSCITQWGLAKNKSENEMRAIVHKEKQRAHLGKASTFLDIPRTWQDGTLSGTGSLLRTYAYKN